MNNRLDAILRRDRFKRWLNTLLLGLLLSAAGSAYLYVKTEKSNLEGVVQATLVGVWQRQNGKYLLPARLVVEFDDGQRVFVTMPAGFTPEIGRCVLIEKTIGENTGFASYRLAQPSAFCSSDVG